MVRRLRNHPCLLLWVGGNENHMAWDFRYGTRPGVGNSLFDEIMPQTVARLGAEAVLTGHVGPKAFATLQGAGIRVYTGASGNVREAVEKFKAGQWHAAGKADVEGHWV